MGQTLGTVAEIGLARQSVSSFSDRKKLCTAAGGKLGFFLIKPDCKDASGNIIPEDVQMRALLAQQDKEKMQQPTNPVTEMQRGGSKNRKKKGSSKKKRHSNRNKSTKNR